MHGLFPLYRDNQKEKPEQKKNFSCQVLDAVRALQILQRCVF